MSDDFMKKVDDVIEALEHQSVITEVGLFRGSIWKSIAEVMIKQHGIKDDAALKVVEAELEKGRQELIDAKVNFGALQDALNDVRAEYRKMITAR